MEKTGEMAMWDKRPKSNLLLKSKIKTLSPKHNLPAGQVVCYTVVFSVVGESPTTIKTVTQTIITWLLGYTADYDMTASQARPADCIVSETHKGLKRVTRVQCLWIFILTSLVPRRSRLGQSWTLPWAVTSPRETSRGQRGKRERLGTRLHFDHIWKS